MKKLAIMLIAFFAVSTCFAKTFIYVFVNENNVKQSYFRANPKNVAKSQPTRLVVGPINSVEHKIGYDNLSPIVKSNYFNAAVTKMDNAKPVTTKIAENAMIEFLVDEGFLPSVTSSIPADIQKNVTSNLLTQARTSPSQPTSSKLGRFGFFLNSLNGFGKSMTEMRYNPGL